MQQNLVWKLETFIKQLKLVFFDSKDSHLVPLSLSTVYAKVLAWSA